MAATGPDDHVPVLLQDDVGAVVEVENRDGVQLGRGAARLGHRVWVDEVDLEHTAEHGRGEKPRAAPLRPPYVYKGHGPLGPNDRRWRTPSTPSSRQVTHNRLNSAIIRLTDEEQTACLEVCVARGSRWPVGHAGPGRSPSWAVPCAEGCLTAPLDSDVAGVLLVSGSAEAPPPKSGQPRCVSGGEMLPGYKTAPGREHLS